MPKCTQCGAYARPGHLYCHACHSEKNGGKENDTASGMNDREYNYRFNMIKGKIAETLIQELFLQMKYSVFRYGMENTIPGVMDLLKGVKSEVAEEIKRMPDFVIQNPVNGEVYFLEVKFRASGKFSFKDLPKEYAWENVFFVVVSKRHIKCITYQELKEGKEITPESRNYLGSRAEFETDKETIKEFCEFALTFFEGV